MSQKPKRSFGIIIRRFLAGFLLFSIVMGLIEDITSGNFSRTSMDGFALGLIIVFFLAFYSRKNSKSKKVEFEDETSYREKVTTLRESYFSTKPEVTPSELSEDVKVENQEVGPGMEAYVQALSRWSKK